MRRTLKTAKRDSWRSFCNSVGRETDIGKVWSVIRRMNGITSKYGYPVLSEGEVTAVKEEEKADMMAKTFVKIHSSSNISEEGQRGSEITLAENREILQAS